MKANELRNMTTAEIEQKIAALKEELFNLRFQLATGQLDNTARIRQVRKDIARAKTVLRERELGINSK
ncbi:large subunit ribosomal protein L29 [Caldalkalibacillus uzonensis]|uniref:Large ribosomal subunit protein uL29 n=1 Tax=Caldalkalibacillus uzonensis TaxID=353224 RepID=A0ABU0CUV0_9BACI|nr:50S ribosomal protein L29 [Caldalkalibacillus uzonensis]MDQ0340194.1 large subunit ribosomal protein L29 [Caldalkalibacillus uzonensis]